MTAPANVWPSSVIGTTAVRVSLIVKNVNVATTIVQIHVFPAPCLNGVSSQSTTDAVSSAAWISS